MLNEQSNDVGYLLGRIFAIYKVAIERTGDRLSWHTMRDFAQSPQATFAALNSKYRSKPSYQYESLLMPLIDRLTGIPDYLPPKLNSTFILGYYHQYATFDI